MRTLAVTIDGQPVAVCQLNFPTQTQMYEVGVELVNLIYELLAHAPDAEYQAFRARAWRASMAYLALFGYTEEIVNAWLNRPKE